MMEQIGLTAAKAHWSEIINRVNQGESFTITKYGRPIARLTPIVSPSRDTIKLAFQELDKLSEKNSLGGLKVRDLIEKGRRPFHR